MNHGTGAQYRLTVVARDSAGAAPQVRVLSPGEHATVGAAGSDLPLGDPYGRAVYCRFDVEAAWVRVTCFSEARGAWVYVPAAGERAALADTMRAEHFDAGVEDPGAPTKLWVRTRSAVRTLDARRAVRLSSPARPEMNVPRFGLVLLPAGNVTIERVEGPGASQLRAGEERRVAPGSAPQSPFVAHAIRPSLEHRVREAARAADLEELLDGVSLECAHSEVRRVSGGALPLGPWRLPLSPPSGARECPDLADVLRVSSEASGRAGADPDLVVGMYEIPLMLRRGPHGAEPYALLVAQPRGAPERALLYRLKTDTLGRDFGDLVAERFDRLHAPAPAPAWNTVSLPAAEPWVAPPLALWSGLESHLDAILATVPAPSLRVAERVWQDLQAALERALDGRVVVPDAVLEAASRLAWLRRDLALAGLVAHETLRRRLDALTADRTTLRKCAPAQIVDLAELAAMALNCGVIGDDNRQKLLNRLAHLLLLFVPSEPAGSTRRVLLPSGCLTVLDATAVEAHERWCHEGAARRGDRRLLESIADPVEVLACAGTMVARWGFTVPEARTADARHRVHAMLA